MRRTGVATLAVVAACTLAPSAHAYRVVGPRWPGQTITYANQAPHYAGAVRRAVRTWNRARIGIRFRRAPAATARVLFRYSPRGRGFGPTGCEGIAGGTVPGWPGPYFRAVEVQFTRSCRSAVIRNLTAAHELGHVLGLGHESRRCALMNATGDAFTGIGSKCGTRPATVRRLRRRLLTRDDVRGARAIYRRAFRQSSQDRLIANFNPGDGTRFAFRPEPVRFSSVTRNAALSYRWHFGDPGSGPGNAASGFSADYAFSGPGTYTITLRVFDGGAEIGSRTARLTLFR